MKPELIVSQKSTIQDALQSINVNSKGAVAVVDDNGKFVRIVTDGDIRRSFLSGSKLDTILEGLEKIINPIVAEDHASASEVLALMNEHEIDQMVYIDKNGRPLDLKHRREIEPVLLSSPHMGHEELKYVNEAFETNWIAPLGPNVKGFESELASITDNKYAVALSSGTAAIHLSLVLLNVSHNDIVLCSSLTFVATANPILYQNATPVFVDSEMETWNMCPKALEIAIVELLSKGTKPKAILLVHLYGQPSKIDEIMEIANKYEIAVIEDAAESLGATYKGRHTGSFGLFGIYSFNGNKIITTSGGGMLVTPHKDLAEKAVYLSTQARENSPYYQHTVVGYNYRMSNVLAGIGRGQLTVLQDRVNSRRKVFETYEEQLKGIEQIDWMPELKDTYANRWLTAMVLNPAKTDVTPAHFINKLKEKNIEARHVWKPMHLQPLFEGCQYVKSSENSVSDYLFNYGVCLPSGSNLTVGEQQRVIEAIKSVFAQE